MRVAERGKKKFTLGAIKGVLNGTCRLKEIPMSLVTIFAIVISILKCSYIAS